MKYSTKTSQHLLSAIALTSIAVFFSASLEADILVQYDMELNGSRHVASTVFADTTASNLTGNNLNTPNSFTLASVDAADDYIAWSRNAGSAQTTAVGVIADNTYFSFTLSPDAGKSISIDSVSFDAAAGTAGPSDRQFYLFADKSGYLSGNVLSSASTVIGSPLLPYNTTTFDQNFSVTLSGNSAFQNITDSVTFRIYIATPTTGQNVGFDEITVNGSVIPEPGTYALLGGLCALTAVVIRRRRR
jgi:hypothetical protein